MAPFKYSMITLAVAGALSLSGCGGGGSSSKDAETTRSVTGVVTGFGSVFVGGVRYETDLTDFTIDDMPGLESDLEVGMVVTVQGTVNSDGTTGTAVAIEYEEEVEGLVLANNVAADGTLNVMGQIVHIDDQTNLESHVDTVTSFEEIAVNHYIEVSGFSSGHGEIFATHIEVKRASLEDDDELEIKGIVSNHDAAAQTFMIGELTVDYSQATFDDFSEVMDGLYIEAESSQNLVDGILIADKLELEYDADDDDHDDIDEMEFEGVITAVNDDNSIIVNNITVLLNNDTDIEDGTIDHLMVGVKVSVEGEFNADGDFIAEEIEFKPEAELQLEGIVENVDADHNRLTVMGQTIVVTPSTLMEDDADDNDQTPERYFNVSDLSVGDWVEIDAYEDNTSGELIATQLERDDDDGDDQSLEGWVEDISIAGQITVSGIVVDVSALEGFSIMLGDYVEVEGTFNNGVFVANSLELDD